MFNIKEINDAKHIVISIPNHASISSLASASALYTYFLQLHKKVSLHCSYFDYGVHLDFIPWKDKIKTVYPSSADYEINTFTPRSVFAFFIREQVKINEKMATSLYAGLIDNTDAFSKGVDGTVFAMAEVLVKAKADTKKCSDNLIHYQTYAILKLKAKLLSKIQLVDDASHAVFMLNDEDLLKSGAKVDDAKSVFKEALGLPSVTSVSIIYNNKTIMKEEI